MQLTPNASRFMQQQTLDSLVFHLLMGGGRAAASAYSNAAAAAAGDAKSSGALGRGSLQATA